MGLLYNKKNSTDLITNAAGGHLFYSENFLDNLSAASLIDLESVRSLGDFWG